jgi:hypothetical protein
MEDKILHQYSKVESVLAPCTSFETAHIVHDYPYGGYRTDMAYWVEFKKSKGFRPVTCSLNPKSGKWNKPHAGVYTRALALYIEAGTGYTQFAHFSMYDGKFASEWLAEFESGLTYEGIRAVKLAEFEAEARESLFRYNDVMIYAYGKLAEWEKEYNK